MVTYQTTIKLHHTDAAGILFFSHQFSIIHEAYEVLFEQIGFSFARLIRESDFFLPIVHAESDYKAPLFVGDRIIVDVNIANIGNTSFTLEYKVTNSNKRIVGTAKTVHVSIDKQNGKKISLPEDLRNALTKSMKA